MSWPQMLLAGRAGICFQPVAVAVAEPLVGAARLGWAGLLLPLSGGGREEPGHPMHYPKLSTVKFL